jgi:hypothetical protein
LIEDDGGAGDDNNEDDDDVFDCLVYDGDRDVDDNYDRYDADEHADVFGGGGDDDVDDDDDANTNDDGVSNDGIEVIKIQKRRLLSISSAIKYHVVGFIDDDEDGNAADNGDDEGVNKVLK